MITLYDHKQNLPLYCFPVKLCNIYAMSKPLHCGCTARTLKQSYGKSLNLQPHQQIQQGQSSNLQEAEAAY